VLAAATNNDNLNFILIDGRWPNHEETWMALTKGGDGNAKQIMTNTSATVGRLFQLLEGPAKWSKTLNDYLFVEGHEYVATIHAGLSCFHAGSKLPPMTRRLTCELKWVQLHDSIFRANCVRFLH
jgi:hypothetical protein